MVSKAEIVAIYRVSIMEQTQSKSSNTIYKKLAYLSLVIMLVLVCGIGVINNEHIDVVNNIKYIISPITSLYSDKNDLQFTWSDSFVVEDGYEFYLPLMSNNIKIVDGNIIIQASLSTIIKPIESGVIESIGDSIDGVRYIKIKHSENLYSIIENIDIISVHTGDYVTRDTIVGTSNINDSIICSLYKDDSRLKNISIYKNKILVDVDV